MAEKTTKKLKFIFIIVIVICILAFVGDVLYVSKYITVADNIALERWGIILTLGGIFVGLKLLHPALPENNKFDREVSIKKYCIKYYTRLLFLLSIFVFNLASLYITGIKNFSYLAFITLVALLLCAPNKTQIESKISDESI